jgi:hypothetical protein
MQIVLLRAVFCRALVAQLISLFCSFLLDRQFAVLSKIIILCLTVTETMPFSTAKKHERSDEASSSSSRLSRMVD